MATVTDATPDNGAATRIKVPSRRQDGKSVLYIDATTPTPDQNSGSIDAINLMHMFRDLGFRLTFIPEDNFMHSGKYTERLQKLGIRVIHLPFYSSVRNFIESDGQEFDMVVLSRVEIVERYLDMVRTLIPRTKIVFNTVDLHGLRTLREAHITNEQDKKKAANAIAAAEMYSITKADATIVLSRYEKALLEDKLRNANIHLIPLLRDCHDQSRLPGFWERRHIMFVGTYQHPPNHDAAMYLVKKIWPAVHKQLPDVRLLLVGSSITPEIQGLAGDGVEVLGFVEDLDGLIADCRLTVAPLRYGAGLKGKVATSLLAGVPMVATDIAVEGTELIDGQHILIANEPGRFSEAMVRLYTEPTLWANLSAAGLVYARKEYGLDANLPRVRALLDSIGLMTSDECRMGTPLHRSEVYDEASSSEA
jgi:glycosyltransferase involved in cell wall biosynthesis